MHRAIILLSLLPILASLLTRRFFSDRILKSSSNYETSIAPLDLAEKMLLAAGHEDIKVTISKSNSNLQSDIKGKSISLPAKLTKSDTALTNGKAALIVGLYLLSIKQPKLLAQRQWAIRLGYVLPVFVLIIVIFAVVLAKLPMIWILSVIIGSISISCVAQLYVFIADRQAAVLAEIILNKRNIFTRSHEKEAVILSIRAWSWHGIVPGLLAKFM